MEYRGELVEPCVASLRRDQTYVFYFQIGSSYYRQVTLGFWFNFHGWFTGN